MVATKDQIMISVQLVMKICAMRFEANGGVISDEAWQPHVLFKSSSVAYINSLFKADRPFQGEIGKTRT